MSSLSVADLRATLERWAAAEHVWTPAIRHDPAERVYALLHRDRDVEVYLVCWMPGHDTGFHDHDRSAAAIAVVTGSVVEARLALSGAVDRTLAAGDVVTIGREAIHRVRHGGGGPAVTIHAYSPPLQRVGAYEIADDGALLRHPRAADAPLEAAA